MAAGSAYSDDEKSQLRKWWNAGISTAEIGRRLGRTKNSVVGMITRLDPPVTRRESPIKPIAIPRPEPVRATTETLPPLASAPPPPAHQPRKFMDPLWQAPKVRVPPPQPQVPPPVLYRKPRFCQFVTSERRPWTFCDQPVDPDDPAHSWCPAHHKKFKLRTRKQMEERDAAD